MNKKILLDNFASRMAASKFSLRIFTFLKKETYLKMLKKQIIFKY